MANLKFAFVVLMCMAVVGAPIAQAITCGQVVTALSPCIGYLTKGGPVPRGCCAGVKQLLGLAQTTADRRTACGCLKSAAAAISGYNDQNAVTLPGKCGVRVPYKISVTTNCATVN